MSTNKREKMNMKRYKLSQNPYFFVDFSYSFAVYLFFIWAKKSGSEVLENLNKGNTSGFVRKSYKSNENWGKCFENFFFLYFYAVLILLL